MKKNKLVPLSILIAGVIVSGSLLYSRDFSFNVFENNNTSTEILDISPISSDEPMLGNPEAPIVFVEYSDTECPFCVSFTKERERTISLYGEGGHVAWVYRSLPTLGNASWKKGLALECVAEESKDYRFWNYLREVQGRDIKGRESGEIDMNLLTEPLERLDLPAEKIAECIEEKRHIQKLRNNVLEAKAVGAEKTPFIVVLLSEKISMIQEEKIKTVVRDMPASIFTIPPQKDRLIMNGAIPAGKIAEIIEIIISP